MANKAYNKIYSNFLGGLSLAERNTREGTYLQGENIDPHRSPGFIKPGWAHRDQTSSVGGVLTGLIVDAIVDPAGTIVYAIDSGKLYKIASVGGTFTNDGNFPHAVSTGSEVFFYNIGSNRRLFYLQATDIGMCVIATPTFDDDWGSTIPAGAGALQSAPHPKLEWKTYMFIGNGRYVARLDGQTGANGTIELTKLDLGADWEVTSMFSTDHFIGVCAWRKMASGSFYKTECKVFMWDGTSTDYNYSIPIEDNKIMSSLNDSGTIYLLTTGRGFGHTIRVLTSTGSKQIRNLKLEIDDTWRYFYATYPNSLELFQNRLLIGANANGYGASILTYGSTNPDFPPVLAQPYYSTDCYGVTNSQVGFIGQLFLGSINASFFNGTNYYFQRYAGSTSTNAKLKMPYTDLGQNIRINYIKFYFKPLVSGDDITISIDTNYGTANTIGTIKYSTDGAITSKIFRKPIDCHSFRPTITWTAGGVAFSKIVVNYQFISD